MPGCMLNWLSAVLLVLSMAKIVWRGVVCQEVNREASDWQRAMNAQLTIYIRIQCHQPFASWLDTTNVPTKNLRTKPMYQHWHISGILQVCDCDVGRQFRVGQWLHHGWLQDPRNGEANGIAGWTMRPGL